MTWRLGYVAMAVVALLVASPTVAQLDSNTTDVPITISTDAESYGHNDMIRVTGTVSNLKEGAAVTLHVISPQGNIVAAKQLNVDPSSYSFSTSLSTGGALWNYDGRYTIKVQYGSTGVTNKAHIDLVGGTISNPIGTPETDDEPVMECAQDMLAAGDACIEYSIIGGIATGASTSYAGEVGNSLLIEIDAAQDGSITLAPNAPACNNMDYIVFVDGEQWNDVSVIDNNVVVSFFAGNSNVELVGACVIPEFGGIAVAILGATLITVIAVSARWRTSIMPKY